MNQPLKFGLILAQPDLLGTFCSPKQGIPFNSFDHCPSNLNPYGSAHSKKSSRALINIIKNKKATVQLSSSTDVSITNNPNSKWVDKFATQQFNSGKLF